MAFKPEIKPTLSNLNTRTGVKKEQFHFQYWADNLNLDWDLDEDDYASQSEYYLDKVMQLAGLRRATANFVRILTSDDGIKVEYSSGKESYTDGQTVVISAEDDPAKFDKTVAVALHEGSHCLLTDFHFGTIALKQIPEAFVPPDWTDDTKAMSALGMVMNVLEDRRIDDFIYRTAVGYRPYYNVLYKELWNSPEISKALRIKPEWQKRSWEAYISRMINLSNPVAWETRNLLPGMDEIYTLADLPNIRRFDNEIMSYRKYEQEEYTKHGMVKRPSFRTMPNEMFWSLGHGRMVKPEFYPAMWKLALQIVKLMRDNVIEQERTPSDQPNQGGGLSCEDGEEQEGQPMAGDLPNLDTGMGAPMGNESDAEDGDSDTEQQIGGQDNKKKRLTKAERDAQVNEKKLDKEMDKVTDFVKGEMRKKKIDGKIESDVKAMDTAEASLHQVGNEKIGRGRVLVTEQINDAIMSAEWFSFKNRYDREPLPVQVEAFRAGLRMGQILVHRLQVRNEQIVTKYPNQPTGNIDRRMLARLGMELENVFSRSVMDTFKPALIHLSLDASGSMHGTPWNKAVTVATALAYAATKIHNLEVVVSLRGQVSGQRGLAHMAIIHDSRKNPFAHFRKYITLLSPEGATPEGLCFEAILEHVLQDAVDYSVFFVNVSDGQPSFTASPVGQKTVRRRSLWAPRSDKPVERGISYEGATAWTHTRHQINKMREAGVKILSYFVSHNSYAYGGNSYGTNQAFKVMYGEDASFINVSEVTGIVQTLNKLLLKKG